MNVLTKTLKTAWDEANRPLTPVRYDEFEQYVRTILFPRESYDLLFKTQDYSGRNSNTHVDQPDYKLVSKTAGIEFFVESKFRTRFQNQILEWCKFFELKHYQEIDNITPVIVAIGLGGKASSPEKVFLVPVKHIKFVKLYPSLMQKYEVQPGHAVSEKFIKRILE